VTEWPEVMSLCERGVLKSLDVALGVLLCRRSVASCSDVHDNVALCCKPAREGGGGGVNKDLLSHHRVTF
jgi:hypothetical protein